jgi:ribosome-associated protein
MAIDGDLPPGGVRLAPGAWVRADALAWDQSRSGGPGGQHVNTTASKAELRVDLAAIEGLRPRERARLSTLCANRLDAEGRLMISCSETRSLGRNRELALERLRALVLDAQAVPRPRRRTRIPRGARERRLEAKGIRAERKRLRRDGGGE